TGTYTQTSTGAINIELSGLNTTQFDRLAVSGAASLAGTLNVTTLGGFLPNIGDTFRVLTFASHTGDFDTYNRLQVAAGRELHPLFTSTGIALDLVTVVTNQPPVFDAIGDVTVDEGTTVSVTAHATPPETNQTITYSIASGPDGASINAQTGVFTF